MTSPTQLPALIAWGIVCFLFVLIFTLLIRVLVVMQRLHQITKDRLEAMTNQLCFLAGHMRIRPEQLLALTQPESSPADAPGKTEVLNADAWQDTPSLEDLLAQEVDRRMGQADERGT